MKHRKSSQLLQQLVSWVPPSCFLFSSSWSLSCLAWCIPSRIGTGYPRTLIWVGFDNFVHVFANDPSSKRRFGLRYASPWLV